MANKKSLLVDRIIRVLAIEVPWPYIPLYFLLRLSSWFILKFNKRILSFSLTPKLPYFQGYELSDEGKRIAKEVVIVLQGPLNKFDKQITVDYIKAVKNELGVGAVIYSGPDCSELSLVCDFSLEPLQIEGAVNQYTLQQASTLSGLYKAQELGYQFALKLRADSLILRRDSVLYLRNILESSKESRCVVISQQKPFYEPFMSDHLQFAKTSDLILLWEYEWNGVLDISFLDTGIISDYQAPTPEWVLGNSFKQNFSGKHFQVCTASDIDYVFLKYNFCDYSRFDYESTPHFGYVKTTPGCESNVSSVEYSISNKFGKNVYKTPFKR
jgi:hypothetical protein